MRWEPEGESWKGDNPEEYDKAVEDAKRIVRECADDPQQANSILMRWADEAYKD